MNVVVTIRSLMIENDWFQCKIRIKFKLMIWSSKFTTRTKIQIYLLTKLGLSKSKWKYRLVRPRVCVKYGFRKNSTTKKWFFNRQRENLIFIIWLRFISTNLICNIQRNAHVNLPIWFSNLLTFCVQNQPTTSFAMIDLIFPAR